MVYPPIPILAIGQFGNQVLGFVATKFDVQVSTDDVRVGSGGVLHGHHVFQVVVEQAMRFFGPSVARNVKPNKKRVIKSQNQE